MGLGPAGGGGGLVVLGRWPRRFPPSLLGWAGKGAGQPADPACRLGAACEGDGGGGRGGDREGVLAQGWGQEGAEEPTLSQPLAEPVGLQCF